MNEQQPTAGRRIGRPRTNRPTRSHNIRPGFTEPEWQLLTRVAGNEEAITEWVRTAALAVANDIAAKDTAQEEGTETR